MMDLFLIQWPGQALWGTTLGFITLFVGVMFMLGLASRKMTIGALTGFVPFVYIGSQVDGVPVVTNMMYISLVIVCLGLGFKILRSEAWGE